MSGSAFFFLLIEAEVKIHWSEVQDLQKSRKGDDIGKSIIEISEVE